MAIRTSIIIYLFFCSSQIGIDFLGPYFIVWNVGQGQWTTWISETHCLHFDMGGEKNPSSKVAKACSRKQQKLYVSHLDADHTNFIKGYALRQPIKQDPDPAVKKIFSGTHGKTKNQSSQVFVVNKSILIPGDSTSKEEKIWAYHLQSIHGLVLGHHGSRSSTSEKLLHKLPNLKWAISSARYKKYKHPHHLVVERLKKHHVPLLRTEDWGHIWLSY